MNIKKISDIIFFVVLVYMCCSVEALPFSNKKTKYIAICGTAAIVCANIVLLWVFPDLAVAQVSMFTLTIPSMILCWGVSRDKGMRFFFVFCSIDVMGFMLLLIVNGFSMLLHFNENVTAVLSILFVIPVVYIFFKYGAEFSKIMNRVEKKWGVLTLFVLLLYGYSYFFVLYPEPWYLRKLYAPVVIGYVVLVLLSYVLIVKMVIGMSKIHDMEQDELKLKLKIETQNREMEEEKARVMVNQIQPHFIYNVLMSIRYFTKKDPPDGV